jgi:hypothetical protein
MEASHPLPEAEPQPSTVTVLKEHVEGQESIYHFYIGGVEYVDVGATREDDGQGNYSYSFDNSFIPYAAADVRVCDGITSVEWSGPDGDHRPEVLLSLLPAFVAAVVRCDFEGTLLDEDGSPIQ